MFPSAKPKVVAQPKKSKRSRKKPATEKPAIESPKTDPLHIAVQPEWMANYWEQEALWDYYIPEDKQITFDDGKYTVPIVVFRHYEDMLNTKRRADAR